MGGKWPRLRLRFRLSTLAGMIALSAVVVWGGLYFLSPTRRIARQIRADQPTYLRREAVGGLGYVPSWEAEEAIGILIGALGDPSPRVRENALSGLGAHGTRAKRAIPAILRLVDDKDRGVRYSALAVLGLVEPPDGGGDEDAKVVAALGKASGEDADPQNRLIAAVSLLKLGETRMAVPVIARTATDPEAEPMRQMARHYARTNGVDAALISGVCPLVGSEDPGRRRYAIELLLEIAPPSTVTAALRAAVKEDDPEVRRWAAEKLESLSPAADKTATGP